MVGYTENDTITSNEKLIAGCMSGCLTRFLVQPMDVIKIRAQVQKRVKKGSLLMRIAGKIVKEEGVTTFWHGHMLGQLHSVISMGVQFYSYELSTKYTDHLFEGHHKMVQKFLCGVFSGCSVTTSVMPIEVIRVRQILIKEQYKSLYTGAKAVYKTGGIKAFYEGLSASLLMMGPATGLSFLVFTTVQPLVLNILPQIRNAKKQLNKELKVEPNNALDLLLASSFSASVASFISKTATYPLDLVRRRLQIGSSIGWRLTTTCLMLSNYVVYDETRQPSIRFIRDYKRLSSHKTLESVKVPSQARNMVKCKKLIECFKTAFRQTGIRGFYTGWSVALLKAQLTMTISFTAYEMLCYALRLSAK